MTGRMLFGAFAAAAVAAGVMSAAAPARAQAVPPLELVAVLEVESASPRVGIAEAQFLTDAVRKAAADGLDRRRYLVMTRENMDLIVPPQERKCLAGKCYAEIGQKLQARFVVGGRVTDVGSKLGLTLEAYESRTGQLLGSEVTRAEHVDGLVDAVQQAAPALVRRFGGGGGGRVEEGGVAIDRGADVVNAVTDTTGLLVIKSEPSGATVFLNGREVGRAPVHLEEPTGRYVVTAELGRLYHAAREDLQLGTSGARVTLTLRPAFGRLEVTSDPSGSEVWLDGEKAGSTPFASDRQASGTYRLQVKRESHLTHEETLVVEDGKAAVRRVRLEPNWGTIAVESVPPGAALSMDDGAAAGSVTPHVLDRVQPGVHVVRLALPGYGEAVEKVKVERGATARVSATLKPMLGLLVVKSAYADGTPCEGDLAVDGVSTGRTPWKGEVLAVRHEVRVRCGGDEGSAVAVVAHNGRADLDVRVRGGDPAVATTLPAARGDVSAALRPSAQRGRQVLVPVRVSFSEGFVWWDGAARRTHAGMDVGLGLRFEAAPWIRPEVAVAITFESLVMAQVVTGLRWYAGPLPLFARTAAAAMVAPERAGGFLAGLGADVPLGREWWVGIEADATVWSRAVVPVDFRVGVGHAF